MNPSFSPATFAFLRDLKRHNTREWFAANKDRYAADVEAPMLRFIADVGTRLPSISKAFVADPRRFGGSMYRIYRDTRFSADKSPFKTWIAASFRHHASRKNKELTVPGFYLHLGPGEIFAGGGVYHPPMPALTRIRRHIVDNPKAWSAVKNTGLEIEGDTLARAPAGFDPAHPFIADLRHKDFYGGAEFTERDATSAGFVDKYIATCRDVALLMKFLTGALGLNW